MIEIDADGITPTINQETGVITFSVGESAQTGDYVAEISCGEAEPKEVTITVTAPTTMEINLMDNRGRPISSWTVNRIGSPKQFIIERIPTGSLSEISYSLPQSEKFTIELVQDDGTGLGMMNITQDTASDPREVLNMEIVCGSATFTLPITPK